MARNLAVWLVALTLAGMMMGLVLAGAARAQDAAGQWHGMLSTPGGDLRLGITVVRDAAGGLAGTIVSPDQTPQPIPLGEVHADAGKLSFAVPLIHGKYEGSWDPNLQVWTGTFTQGAAMRLVLLKGPVPARNRPQVPAKPYPYKEADVTVASVPGVTLACSLTTPAGKGPFPGVVMITGSGAQDRDEALLGHQPFLVISDHLTRRGVSVLRCDDRGFARSTGVFGTATSFDFADDTEAEANFLRAQPSVDPRRVGLIGHSEGGMIAPIVAVKDPKIAFIVLMAGPGAPIRELMTAQRAAVAKASGVDPAATARNEALVSRLNDAVAAAKDTATARAEAAKIIRTEYPNLPQAIIDGQAAPVSTPWYRAFIAYDPRVALAKVTVPILALDGTKDVQVVSSQNLPAIREATKANKDVTIVELPGLNHLFQTAGTGAPAEYGSIEETVSPVALNLMSDWIVKHTQKGAAK
jgi:pimeloyl-ACP methyl ester carboxylesterase